MGCAYSSPPEEPVLRRSVPALVQMWGSRGQFTWLPFIAQGRGSPWASVKWSAGDPLGGCYQSTSWNWLGDALRQEGLPRRGIA